MGCGASKPAAPVADPKKEAEEARIKAEEEERRRQEAEAARIKAEQERAEAEKQKEIERLKKEEEEAEAARREKELEAAETARKEHEAVEAQRKEEEEKLRLFEEERKRVERKRTCCIVGPPGSIKGKLCELITQNLPSMKHVSTGEVMRDAIKSATPTGLKAQEERKSAGQASEETQLDLMVEHLTADTSSDTRWLLDGYPRNLNQAETLKTKGIILGKLIIVDVQDDDLIRRAVGRRIDPVTHSMYHMEGLGFPAPPDDPEIIARLTARKDDTEDRVRARLQQYYAGNSDISDAFIQVRKIDGLKEPEEVISEVLEFLDA